MSINRAPRTPSTFPPTELDALELSPPCTPTPTERLFQMDEDETDEHYFLERKVFSDFLKMHSCYEMIPASGKIVVLDVALAVKSAFRALIENRIKSAPLWDSTINDYVGMITVTDFIDILRHFYQTRGDTSTPTSQLFVQDEYQIRTWRAILSEKTPPSLISVHPDDSIYEVAEVLLDNNLHRVPIIDKDENNSILHVVSHHRILVFILCNIHCDEKESLLNRSIAELNIGTYNNVVTILKDTPLVVALNLLAERKISSVPLVNETGVVDGVFSKSDAAALAKHNDIFDVLDSPVQQFISVRIS